MTARRLSGFYPAHATTDGAGVAIKRVALATQDKVDPLLLVDELRSSYRADFRGGFPAHPHRGMQTLTYMLSGGIVHEDSMGNRGEILDGGVQWLSAGSGVIHSEMPLQNAMGIHGFQLWFNLPAAEKMQPPRYRDIASDALPTLRLHSASVTALAGTWVFDEHTVTGPLSELAAIAQLSDVAVAPAGHIDVTLDAALNVSVFVFEGALAEDEQAIKGPGLAVFGSGNSLRLTASNQGARCLVVTGAPLGEPVVQYGPFVMNTRQEIETALSEYEHGTFLKH